MGINRAKFPKPSVWVEFELETEFIDPPKVKLKLRPIFQKDSMIRLLPYIIKGNDINDREIEAVFNSSVSLLMDRIIDWDLTLDEKPIPCNEETKKEYLEPLLWEKPKAEEDTEENIENKKPKKTDMWLWTKVFQFAIDLKNFTKN